MKKVKFNTNKSVDVVCREIMEMVPNVLGTKPVKQVKDKEICIYPACRFLGTDDAMNDVRIIIRKVNNNLTNIRLENTEFQEKEVGGTWRVPALIKAYNTLEKVLGDMHTDNHMNSYSSFDEYVKEANNSCSEDTVSNVAVKVTELLSRTVIVKAKDYSEAKAKVEEAYHNGNLQLGMNVISVELELKDDTEKYINIFGKEEFESMEVSEEFLHL